MQQTQTHDGTPPPQRRRLDYLGSKLIEECHPGDGQEPLHLIRWWKRIFELLDPPHYDPTTHTDRIHLRCLCNMFNAALKPPPKGRKGKWTEFPHPNHPTLQSLITRCHQLYDEDPRRAPTIIFIKEGDHEVEDYLEIKYALQIIGAGRDKTFILNGGFHIQGKNEEGKNVVLKDFTMKRSKVCGLANKNGLSFLCDSLTITQCGRSGVYAWNTKGRLINCVITQCKYSGMSSGNNALIELEGSQTKIHGNVTSGHSSFYGLHSYTTTAKIHLLFPLTKESVSTNNGGRGNHGCRGTIQTVSSF
jgi:hypothetical protein